MGIENFIETLHVPEDALKLCDGKPRSQKVVKYYILNNQDVLDAAEILILLNDANNLCSKADVIERAMSYGWEPVNIHAWETQTVEKKPKAINRSMRYFWKSILIKTAKLLLTMIPKRL